MVCNKKKQLDTLDTNEFDVVQLVALRKALCADAKWWFLLTLKYI